APRRAARLLSLHGVRRRLAAAAFRLRAHRGDSDRGPVGAGVPVPDRTAPAPQSRTLARSDRTAGAGALHRAPARLQSARHAVLRPERGAVAPGGGAAGRADLAETASPAAAPPGAAAAARPRSAPRTGRGTPRA